MTDKEKAAAYDRYKHARSRIVGLSFEDIIDAACTYYRDHWIADIEKTPEPLAPVKELPGRKFIAVYKKKAQTDFKGTLAGGHSINFEAKATESEKMSYDRVTPGQAQRLERAYKLGGVAFVLCRFGPLDFYRIPWEVWRAMKEAFGHKYITPQEIEPFRVRFGGPGVLLFLEGLEVMKK